MTKFDKMVVATLQLSTDDCCAIFDCVALKDCQEFKHFLLDFFSNQKIEKIGHSFSSDIKVLNNTFGISLVNIKI